MYNNIAKASKLAQGANYHLFKEGVEPKWEDPENERGGKWIVIVPAKERDNGALDKYWLWTLLAVIGEAFDDETEVCGCVVSVRKGGDKISLWTKSALNEAVNFWLRNPLQYEMFTTRNPAHSQSSSSIGGVYPLRTCQPSSVIEKGPISLAVIGR